MGLHWVFILALTALTAFSWSMPATGHFYTVTQPDGSTVEVRKVGNEHNHYTETQSGQILHRDSSTHFRSPTVLAKFSPGKTTPVTTKSTTGKKNILVVLVQFQDTKFFSNDPNKDISRILSEEGYSDENSIGSAADYFKDNSMGTFTPIFNVVGPITVSGYNYKDYGAYSELGDLGAQAALMEALDSIKKQGTINFKDYDNDNNGTIDFIHMIYAGFGAHDSDQDSAIWPHRWLFQTQKNMGSFRSPAYLDEYSCNSERDWRSYYYNHNSKKYFGVGNFIHEFSHQLGLPDLYATNDAEVHTPYIWDVMDMGAYNTGNEYGPIATAPPYYSSYERYTLGWMTPTNLTTESKDTLIGIQNNSARWLRNPKNTNEFFLLEYRDKTKWDRGLPNHGLLIWHIDFKKTVWEYAAINNTEHQYVDIEEADGIANVSTLTSDVFPGTRRITKFSKFITWENENLGVVLKNIQENRSYTNVTFDVIAGDSVELAAEDFIEDEEDVETDSTFADTVSTDTTIVDTLAADTSVTDSADVEDAFSTLVFGLGNPRIWLEGNNLTISGLIPETKKVQIFSINGHLVKSVTTNDTRLQLKLPNQNTPFLLCISRGKTLLYTKRIR